MRRTVLLTTDLRIIFQESFNPTLKQRVKSFLASDTPPANFTKGVLIVAALGGIFAVGAAAPNFVQVLKLFDTDKRRKLSKLGYWRLRCPCAT